MSSRMDHFKVLIGNKLCNFISLYRSPSQPTDIFDQFADNLELTVNDVTNRNSFPPRRHRT